MEKLNITGRTKVERISKRASYDADVIHKILDDVFVCQVGFSYEDNVYIIPTLFGRKDNFIYFHGSKNSRMLKSFSSGKDVCITVTITDGLVLARSAFHHSVNYRSAVMFGKPEEIINNEEKTKALEIIMEHIIPGRWNDVRKPNEKELNVTSVFSFKIEEASAKIRTGPPADDKEDYNLNVWAGTLPIHTLYDEPVRDELLQKDVVLPGYIKDMVI